MFIQTPILRGFQEIECLFNFATKHNSVICGGYGRYCVSKKRNPFPATDIDLFPQTEESSQNLINELISLGFSVKYQNEVSLTFNELVLNSDVKWTVLPQVQVIKPVKEGRIVTIGSLEEILSNFDFSITRAGLLNSTTALVDEHFHADDAEGRIRIQNIHCPISSTLRVIKYSKKNYWITASETVKLFKDWDARPIEYKDNIVSTLQRIQETDEDKKPTAEEIARLYRLMSVD